MTSSPLGSGLPPARPGMSLNWTPTPGAARRMLAAFALGGAVIGVVGFSLSFWSVADAARPYLGWASWALPVLTDVAIFTLSGLSIFLEMHEIKARWIRLIPDALVGYTVYLNTATQPSVFGKAVHAAGPLLWVAVVEIGAFTVRRLVGLSAEDRMDRVRFSRWILAPFGTFRLWRRMRLWEVTDYKVAVGREHERSASAALLRQWYGRRWRGRAPRAERLAVRLQGATAEPVADLLARSSGGITAAARAAAKPLPDTPEPAPAALPEAGAHVRPAPPALVPALVGAAVDSAVDTGPEGVDPPSVHVSLAPKFVAPATRLETGEAAARIRAGWEMGWSVTDTAAYSTRDKAQVSRTFAQFDTAGTGAPVEHADGLAA